MAGDLEQFVRVNRARFTCSRSMVRTVYCSDIVCNGLINTNLKLEKLLFDRTPLFYRRPEQILDRLKDGYFATAFSETLHMLPNSTHFRQSHMGEILAMLFAEEVMGLRQIYSKLSSLSTQNSNAFKMDLVMYDPATRPVDIVFGEVKCSDKFSQDGNPVGHDKSCFSSLFESVNSYGESDQAYDLTAARDNLHTLPVDERERVRESLKPYSNANIRTVGIVVIDNTTYHDEEVSILATRKNKKTFDVDVVAVERFGNLADTVFSKLEELRKAICTQ